jgi:uncharacterized membrane protein YoaK (UPF0700 family)
MDRPMNGSAMTRLLSLNAGFVDTVGFLGLQGLFTAHVTGNFVTLAAGLVYGPHGAIGKTLALPEFVVAVAVARLVGAKLTARGMPTLTILIAVEAVLLAVFLFLGVAYGPFPNSDVLPALAAGFAGITAMALQNAMQRVHFPGDPPTAIMTNNTTQAVLDGVDQLRRAAPPEVRGRFLRTVRSIAWFAGGCAVAALFYYFVQFSSLALPVGITSVIAIARLRDQTLTVRSLFEEDDL